MKRILALLFLLPACSLAQSEKTRSGLYTEIDSTLASGQEITAAQVRGVLKNLVASAQNIQSDGTAATAANLTSHTSNTSNPHSVTKTQVGLGNVDNTSDANKPVSSATQTALNAKAALSHTHAVADVSDSTLVGRTLVTATDAATARMAIGAGTSSFSGAYADLTGKPTLGTAAALNVAASGNAASGEVVKGNDSRLSDSRSPTTHTHPAGDISDSSSIGRSLVTAASAPSAAAILGLGTSDSPQLGGINVGHATDTTVTRSGPGDIAVEGNTLYRAGGTDVAVADGGTGQGSYTDGQLLIGNSSGNGLTKATLTAGANVTITNGNGSITIAASGGGGGGDDDQIAAEVPVTPAGSIAADDVQEALVELDSEKQPLDADLTDLADGSLSGSKVGSGIDGGNISAGTVADARVDSAIARDAEVAAAYQPLDSDLTDLADGSLTGSKVGTGIDGANVSTGVVAVANGGTGQSSYTDGQLLIGNSSGNGLTKTTLTAGSNVTITNGNGSITIAASGGGGASDTIISPSQLTADTDDWNPTGLSSATIIRVDSDSTLRYLSSLTAPGGGAIQRLRLINVGSNTLILKDQASGLGTAANRLALGGYDLPLFPAGSIDLVYDPTSTRWRAVNPQSHVIPPRRYGAYLANLSFPIGPSSNTSTYAHNLASATSGTGASAGVVTADSGNVVSYLQEATGTDTTGRASHAGGSGQFLLGNGWYWRFTARVRLVALSDAADTYTYRVGLGDNTSGESTDAVFVRYTHGTNSGRFELVLRSNNSESVATEVGGGAAPVANTWFNLDVVVTGTRAEAYKDGVLFASTTTMTNLPSGSGRTTGVLAMMIKSAGTTSRAAHLAYLETVGYLTTP